MPDFRGRMTNEDDATAVRELESVWDRLCPPLSEAERESFQQLVTRWGAKRAVDPIVINCDLLSPLGQEFRETSHTQALGYLLDSTAGHGLGARPLKDFLSFVDSLLGDADLAAFQAASEDANGCAILLERSAIADLAGEEATTERLSRTDLWLEIPATEPRALVVVEAKIDGVATATQLERYDRLIDQRLQTVERRIPVVKVYLTPWGDTPPTAAGGSGWIAGSMWQLAAMMLPTLDETGGPGTEFQRLYLATVLQRLVGLRWTEQPGRVRQRDLAAYLALRLEHTP